MHLCQILSDISQIETFDKKQNQNQKKKKKKKKKSFRKRLTKTTINKQKHEWNKLKKNFVWFFSLAFKLKNKIKQNKIPTNLQSG